uniref:Uncharacterized protein n=1 Tax=Cacopsylla melanoneura TaxID=428564 RepID=A0A8D8W8X0_9HEMI
MKRLKEQKKVLQENPKTINKNNSNEKHAGSTLKTTAVKQPGNTGDKKGVKFNEKGNAFYDNTIPWDKIGKVPPSLPTSTQQTVPHTSDKLTKSILKKRPRSATPDAGNVIDNKGADVKTGVDRRNEKFQEAFKDLKDKVVRSWKNNQKKDQGGPDTEPLRTKSSRGNQSSENRRPLGYLSTKLRRLKPGQHASRSKKGAKTWPELITNSLKGFIYTAPLSSEEEAKPESVVVFNRGGASDPVSTQRGNYFSSSSDTESPRLTEKAKVQLKKTKLSRRNR